MGDHGGVKGRRPGVQRKALNRFLRDPSVVFIDTTLPLVHNLAQVAHPLGALRKGQTRREAGAQSHGSYKDGRAAEQRRSPKAPPKTEGGSGCAGYLACS